MSDLLNLELDQKLPVAGFESKIRELIANHQVVVVAGETGSGKTTQLPKICMKLGRTKIAHTQPRRIAARSVAARIAEELSVELGQQVGYQVRFNKVAQEDSWLTVMTDGILLNQINFDPLLSRYDTIIIDEAHERSLNIDFLLGYLKTLLNKRQDLKVIITSATIDTARFSAHFDDAPIVEVSGRSYPVEIRYRPMVDIAEDGVETPIDQIEAIGKAVTELKNEGSGDILVFLSGEREIADTADYLADMRLPNTEICPLYARLSAPQQQQVFKPGSQSRIVLATNVAETSITVPRIKYVIDAGLARISRYSNRTKVQRLPIEPISQASANQRAGRCGRLSPGICIRLYSEEDFLSRPQFTEPEILRTNLASVILQMAAAKLGNIADFPFVERPDWAQISDGIRLLTELGALKPGKEPRLTKIGRQLAKLPVDPRLGRMLLAADKLDCLNEVITVVSAISIPDVREYPLEHREHANQLHRRFFSDGRLAEAVAKLDNGKNNPIDQLSPDANISGGDIAALLRLWKYLAKARKSLSGNQFRKLCRNEYLSFLRIRQWQDLRLQLKQVCKDLNLKRNSSPATHDSIVTAVLAGLLSHLGLLTDLEKNNTRRAKTAKGKKKPSPNEYIGARGIKFAIQPGSALAKLNPDLVVCVEIVETSRLWARTVEPVKASWVEKVGADLFKISYGEPYWSIKTGAVLANSRASLFGVPIYTDRPVGYSRIDRTLAREIFIKKALVEGEWNANYPFVSHNEKVKEQLTDLEQRTRRVDFVVSDEEIYHFFDRKIPQQVCSASSFAAWWRKGGNRTSLKLDLDKLIDSGSGIVNVANFPDKWVFDDFELAIKYVFDPSDPADGVSVTIPLALLNRVPVAPFSWHVPGMRVELIRQMIKTLPKNLRTNFVPIPQYVESVANLLDSHSDQPVTQALSQALLSLTGVQVPASAWKPELLPGFLRIKFVVVDGEKTVAISSDLAELKQKLNREVSQKLTKAAKKILVTGAREWTFGKVAAQISIDSANSASAIGYPALTDEGQSVGLVVCESKQKADYSHRAGVSRLLVLTNPDPTRWVVAHLSNPDKYALAASPYPSVPDLLADAWLKTSARLGMQVVDLAEVRDESTFKKIALEVRQHQADQMRKVVANAAEALRSWSQVEAGLAKLAKAARTSGLLGEHFDLIHNDIAAQVKQLVFDGFVSDIADPWYDYLPRYLAAAALRCEAALLDPVRDQKIAEPLYDVEDEYFELCSQFDDQLPAKLEEIGFLLEELRVQIFAQKLTTAVPVSAKKIRKALRDWNSA